MKCFQTNSIAKNSMNKGKKEILRSHPRHPVGKDNTKLVNITPSAAAMRAAISHVGGYQLALTSQTKYQLNQNNHTKEQSKENINPDNIKLRWPTSVSVSQRSAHYRHSAL